MQGGRPSRSRRDRDTNAGAGSTPGRVDRLPPHAPDAERGVLGCILISPNDALGECVRTIRAGAEAFYDLRHQAIYSLVIKMYDDREPIDLITVQQRLRDAGQLEAIGGLTYLNQLADAVPSAANLSYYIEIVLEKHLLRRMLQTCTNVIGRVYECEDDVPALLDEVERDILHINEERERPETKSIKELVNSAITTIEELHARQGMLSGVSTGFPDLDKMTTGLHKGEMVVIAARPSMGKTSLAMNIAEHVAIDLQLAVGVFSLEMTAESLVLRMMCSRAEVNLRDVREGFLAERDFPRLTQAAGQIAGAPLLIDDTSGLSILQLRARARRMWQQSQIKLLVIDYLQLVHSDTRRAKDNRQQEISEISSGIKALAKELEIPIIILSQLNRDVEKDKSRKPKLSDLRESGAIEQDADLVGLLYKPSTGDDDESVPRDEPGGIPVSLLIAKQRNGPTGDVPLTFLKRFTRFKPAAKVDANDVS
ncbi:MAG: replicative DNA helicase [Verrucomicrobiales bacterium]|nr:replicative DNA helicase [Verrucomicrobiales bacterium]